MIQVLTINSLRSLVSALFWLTIGIAAAICIALAPVSQDPYLVWMYGSLAIVGFVAGIVFYVLFGRSFGEVQILESVETIVTHRDEETALNAKNASEAGKDV